jgi:hypothetical protein
MPPEGSDLIFDHRHNADVRTLKRTVRFTLLVTIRGNIPSIRGQVKSYGSSQLAVALLTGHRHK